MANHENEAKKRTDDNNEKEKRFHMAKKIWNVLKQSGFWLVIFTGLLTVFTYNLYQVAKLTSDNTRSSQRALMNLGTLGIGVQLTDPTGRWAGQELAAVWLNTGDTAAKAAVFQSNIKPELEELPKGYDFPLLPVKTQGVVAPKGNFSVTLNVPVSQLVDAWRGNSRLIIWGDVVYKDVFPGDPDRLSEFCLELTHLTVAYMNQPEVKKGETLKSPVLGEPNTRLANFSWQPCGLGVHTCYDEDCKDYPDRVKDMRQ